MLAFLLSLMLAVPGGATDSGAVFAKGQRFQAEVARTDMDRARGLMYRQSLAKDQCMIFLYEEDGYHAIWMKNCLISLDVVWTLADGTIVEMTENVPPCSPVLGNDCPNYGGTQPSRFFVEFAPGTIRRLGLKKGDRLGWELSLGNGQALVGGAPAPKDGPKAKGRKK
ncbi:MAG: hypothetical protein H6Q00_1568 [Holophagaceae bacterium]|nr:hypothetical protein [Holophagaceae bacterium]